MEHAPTLEVSLFFVRASHLPFSPPIDDHRSDFCDDSFTFEHLLSIYIFK